MLEHVALGASGCAALPLSSLDAPDVRDSRLPAPGSVGLAVVDLAGVVGADMDVVLRHVHALLSDDGALAMFVTPSASTDDTDVAAEVPVEEASCLECLKATTSRWFEVVEWRELIGERHSEVRLASAPGRGACAHDRSPDTAIRELWCIAGRRTTD